MDIGWYRIEMKMSTGL